MQPRVVLPPRCLAAEDFRRPKARPLPDDLPAIFGQQLVRRAMRRPRPEPPQHCSQLVERFASERRPADPIGHRIVAGVLAGRENVRRKNAALGRFHREREIGKEHHRSMLEHGHDARYGRAIWCSPARVRDRSQSAQSSSSSPHGDGCGPERSRQYRDPLRLRREDYSPLNALRSLDARPSASVFPAGHALSRVFRAWVSSRFATLPPPVNVSPAGVVWLDWLQGTRSAR